MFLNLEGFFYVLFSGSYLSAHTKQNLSIHSISENGRKPVKKISASATVLLTLKVEVQSPYNRITISYNRKGHRAFAVFLLSIFVGKCRRAVSDMRCRSPPLHLDFLHFKNSDGRYLDTKNRLLSLDGFTDSEGNPLDFITDEAVDIAETVVNAVMVDRLKAALPLLSDSEQELIQAIFFDGLSEREVGARLGITQSVVNKRKARILIKLRKIIEN